MIWLRLGAIGVAVGVSWLCWWLISTNAVLRADLRVCHDKVQSIIAAQQADRESQIETARLIRQTPDRARVVAARLRNHPLPTDAPGQPATVGVSEPAGRNSEAGCAEIAQAAAEVSEEAQLLKRELIRLNGLLKP